jgi:hypothetical protein
MGQGDKRKTLDRWASPANAGEENRLSLELDQA